MIKKEVKDIDLEVYYKELSNGLRIYLIPQENKNKYHLRYLCNFGSSVDRFLRDGKEVLVPPGTAHFLEHKVFEYEGKDPFSFYAKTGSDVNAYTSLTRTVYLVNGDSNIEENLDYLINFVNGAKFTLESVEKEKGIIIEEIKMYNKDPFDKFSFEQLNGIYHVDPRKNDIGGTIKSVNSITKGDLDNTYNTFYQPSNMAIIVTGNFDKDKVLKVILDNSSIKEKKNVNYEKILSSEPIEVVFKEREKKIEKLQINRMSLSFKFSSEEMKGEVFYKYYLGFNILFRTLFGRSSEVYNELLDNNSIYNLNFGIDGGDHFTVLSFIAETDHPKIVKERIMDALKNKEIKEKDIERIKKSMYASAMKDLDVLEYVTSVIIRDVNVYGDVIYNRVKLFKDIDIKYINNLRSMIDFDNYSFFIGKK